MTGMFHGRCMCAWQECACIGGRYSDGVHVWGMHDVGVHAFMAGGMHGGGRAWQEDMSSGGTSGGGVHGRGHV